MAPDLFTRLVRLTMRPIIRYHYRHPITAADMVPPTAVTQQYFKQLNFTASTGQVYSIRVDLDTTSQDGHNQSATTYWLETAVLALAKFLPFTDTDPALSQAASQFAQLYRSLTGQTFVNGYLTDPTTDLTSDAVLLQLALEGPAAYFLEQVSEETYHIDFNSGICDLPVRPAFENYGAKLILRCHRRSLVIEAITWTQWRDGLRIQHRAQPGQDNWAVAKLRFRCILATWITMIYHLATTHLTVAANFFWTTNGLLSPQHPIRKLLAPFYFRSGRINRLASLILTGDGFIENRVTAFTATGLSQAMALAMASFDFNRVVPGWVSGRHLHLTDQIPYLQDSLLLYQTIRATISDVITKLYPEGISNYRHGSCDGVNYPIRQERDNELSAWLIGLSKLLVQYSQVSGDFDIVLPTGQVVRGTESQRFNDAKVTNDQLSDFLSHLIWNVTVLHDGLGKATNLVSDPSFCPAALRKGHKLPGANMTELVWWLAIFAEIPMPRLTEDFTAVIGDSPNNVIKVSDALGAPTEVVKAGDSNITGVNDAAILGQFFSQTWPQAFQRLEGLLQGKIYNQPSQISCSVSN